MNECFTDLIFGNFSVESVEGGESKTEVSYSVSGDLQVT